MVILYFFGVLPEIARELDNITLPIGKTSISVLTIGKSICAIVVTLVVALWLSGMLEQRLLHATSLDVNTQAVLAKLVRAVLLIVGVLIALDVIGFDLTLLTVFGGALGVGIGLGLQKLAANYIAGFTILIDKSIRLGDLITVDNKFGVVSRVTSRYVVVRSQDGIEAIVPNETLVTTSVLHHPHPRQEIKLVIRIQVAYDVDIGLALRLMEEAARAEPSTILDGQAARRAARAVRRQRHPARPHFLGARSEAQRWRREKRRQPADARGVPATRRDDPVSPARSGAASRRSRRVRSRGR